MSTIFTKIKRIFWLYLPTILWAMLIFILSAQNSLPGFELSLAEFIFKKSAHMAVFGVLFWLCLRATKQAWQINKKRYFLYWLLPLLATALYAISDEFHQSFVSGRTATLRDVGYDILGTLLILLKELRYI